MDVGPQFTRHGPQFTRNGPQFTRHAPQFSVVGVGGDAVVEDLVADLVEAVFETVVQDLAEMVYKVVEDVVAVVVDDDVAGDSERGAGTAGGGACAPSGRGCDQQEVRQ